MRVRPKACWLLLAFLLFALPLEARVVRVDVASRTNVLDGKAFGTAGAYERITGRIYFSLSITNPRNLRIVDLGKAVNLKDGEVEFSADFMAIRPKDPAKSNGSMLLEVPNRGRSRIISLVDGGDWNVEHDAAMHGCSGMASRSSVSAGNGTPSVRMR